MLLLGLFDVGEAIRYLMAWLCSFIYELIASLFELFINISKVELLSSEEITPIYQRVTMILTIVMVFYVTFELVKYILQPDSMKDKEKGASKVVVRMILVVVLIAFVPTAFRYAYKLQNAIIEREVLSKVILGRSNTSSESFGRNFSADMFSLFYSFNEEYWGGPQMCDDMDCTMLVNGNIDELRTTGKIENLTYGLNETETKTEKGVSQDIALIRFDGLFAVLVGGFLVYVLILYCIDLGVRVAQITFLQIIAPIPIIGYLSPKKDNIFNKWVKQCTTTYLDLFIRLSLIYFVLLICKIIADAYNNGTLIQNVDQDSKTYVYIAIIMGLLLFAQKAPKMLQELFPKMGAASGNFGLKAGERVAPLAARAIGAGTGFARAGIRAGIARNANRRKRNKDLKEKLREEGKPTDRKSMRQARREAKRNAKASDKQLKDKRSELAHAERNVKSAEKQLEKAKKTGDKKAIADAEKDLAKEKAKYETIRTGTENINNKYKKAKDAKDEADRKAEKAKTEYDTAQGRTRAAQQKLDDANRSGNADEIEKAQKEFDDAKAAEDKAKAVKEAADQNAAKLGDDLKKAEEDQKTSKNYQENSTSSKMLKEAEENYNKVMDPQSNATEAEKEIAKKRLEQAQKRVELEKYSGYIGFKNDNIDAKSALADERNQTYGTYRGVQAVEAAIRGGITGAVAGAKAKKLEDVWKQSNEGIKKVMKREDENMEFLQNGGSATFSGTVDRTVAHAQQTLHIKTESDRIKSQIKDAQDKAKLLQAQSQRALLLKPGLDEAKERSQNKILAREQKTEVVDKLDAIKLTDGRVISWDYAVGKTDNQGANTTDYLSANYTTTTMYEDVLAQENRVKHESEEADKMYQEQENNYNRLKAKREFEQTRQPKLEQQYNNERLKLVSLEQQYDNEIDENKKIELQKQREEQQKRVNEVAQEKAKFEQLKIQEEEAEAIKEQLRKERDKKSKELKDREAVTKLALKRLGEYGITGAIKGDDRDKILYDILKQKCPAAIENNRYDPAAQRHIRDAINSRFSGDPAKADKIWSAFINNNLHDFEDIDVLEGLMTNLGKERQAEYEKVKGYSDRLSESSWKGSADATAGSGSSNK